MNEDVNNYLRLAIMEEVNKRMGKNFECINDLITYAENLAKENVRLKFLICVLVDEINALWDINKIDEDVRKCVEEIKRDS